eukprot:6205703-Pleurochrysis_carterae.AAC.3
MSTEDLLSVANTTRPGTPSQSDGGSDSDGPASISVVVRLRPLTSAEVKAGQTDVWKHDGEKIWQRAPGRGSIIPQQVYSFDQIFSQTDTTEVIYRACAQWRVARVLQGYNATVFAYGQTSSGKTTTVRGMEGQEGLVPLCTRQLLADVSCQTNMRCVVSMSYMEIYNETIGDLLTGQTGLSIFEKKTGGIFVQDLTEERLYNWSQAHAVMHA